MARFAYSARFDEFLKTNNNEIFGEIVDSYHGTLQSTQKNAWQSEISIIKDVACYFEDNNGKVIFEYDIPRLGKRIDVTLLMRGIIFCLEFKVGEKKLY